ncbi:hypothetical protein MNBD_DELTA01-1919 [hydrothermal vent metagenome]|uniref:DUF3341 domain-containing protein n=1 Tax=hydrothermal vent metagenome TaxID=652676 RepID=A0A3B0R587_9ZZZZ
MSNTMLGMFYYADHLIAAARSLKGAGYGVEVHSSIPLDHELEAEFGRRTNYLKFFTGFGAINGIIFAVVFSLGTSALYVLPRGGRPLFSATPTILLAYVLMILFGVLFTFLGFMILSNTLPIKKKIDIPEIWIEDGFGLVIEDVSDEKFEQVEKILKDSGAGEVKTVDGW